MNPNEIRGYVFFGYGLLCCCFLYLGGYFPNGLFLVLLGLFLLLGGVFFVRAAVKQATAQSVAQPSVLRLGQAWTEFNCFKLQVDGVAVKRGADGQRLGAVQFHVENWLPMQKQDEHNLSVRLQAIAEYERQYAEATILEHDALVVAAGETKQASCTVVLPEQTDRIMVEFVVTLEQEMQTYRQQYAFYPAHYEAR